MGLLLSGPPFLHHSPVSHSFFGLLYCTWMACRRSQRQSSNFHNPNSNSPLKVIASWLTFSILRVIISRRSKAERWRRAAFHKTRPRSKRAALKLLSCHFICLCIPCQPQHLVSECHVLATKHNSSVPLSGCHFTKPERLLEITSICGKTSGRERGSGRERMV